MGDVNALIRGEAIAKIKHVARGEIAMLCTFTADHAMHARPMSTPGVDDDGTLWFLSKRDSAKNRHIAANPLVHLVYAVPARSEFMSLQGQALVLREQKKIDELWSLFDRTWFTRGKDDPEITLVRVTPTGGHYWDTKHHRTVQLAKIAVGALIGRPMDDGVEGTLDV